MTPRIGGALAALCLGSAAWAQVEVGSGAPSQSIAQAFVDAFYRNGFNRLVTNPPLADVRKFGAVGLIQEFQDAAKTSGVRLALIKPNSSTSIPEGTTGVYQVQAAIYAYYNTIGVNNAGYPATDTSNCPALLSPTAVGNSCQYQLLDKPYALFAYTSPGLLPSATLSLRDPFYTRWNAQGGLAVFGPPVTAETSVTGAVSGGVSTAQTLDRGVIFNVTSGSLTGRLLSVKGDIYAVYSNNGGATGFLGYPTGDEVLVAGGRLRQNFEGGSIEYDPATPGSGVLRTLVSNIQLTPGATPLKLNLGETYTLSAALFSSNGAALTDRQVIWTTSNGRVVALQASGATVVLQAVGGGAATVAATSEGKTSGSITVFVSAPCCQIGEGAPTAAAQKAFQDAIVRARIAVKLPAASPVVRAGAGYSQELSAADGSAVLVVVPDKSLTGYVVAGAILSGYTALGGPAGTLGLPTSDATPAGRQSFDGGALAGNPVQLVTGAILAKWAALGYETGAAGSPLGLPANSLTFRATSVTGQTFARGAIYLTNTGPQAGKAYFVSGPVQSAFGALGGVTGKLGAPVSDEALAGARRRQDFEGGFVDYAVGATVAAATLSPRQPLVSATPGAVLAGSTVRLAIGGFEANSTVRVAVTGQPDFRVTTSSGGHVWDVFVPAAAKSATVTVTATQEGAAAAAVAQGTYAIRAIADAKLTLTIARGDGQSGAPGSLAPERLRVSLKDQSGNPAPGQVVVFAASPGAAIEPVETVTGANGEASAALRLPVLEGVTLATASAAHQTVTFSARSAAISLPNYPKMTQAFDQPLGNGPASIRQKGAMLAALASMLRYHQDQGDLPSPNGPADPPLLNQYLKNVCPVDTQGAQVCDGFYSPPGSTEQIVNAWRVPSFAGNAADVAVVSLGEGWNAVRDLISQGSPVLIPLAIRVGGVPQGAHYVVGIGVAADGGIRILDPDPAYGRTLLNDYLIGFTSNRQITATPTGTVLRFSIQPFRTAFLAIAGALPAISSLAGPCGPAFKLLDVTAAADGSTAVAPRDLYFAGCDGTASTYQLDLAADPSQSVPLWFRDLGNPGFRVEVTEKGAVSKSIVRSGAQWVLDRVAPRILANGIVNSASGTPDIAPGGILSIYGAGFGVDPGAVKVEVNGVLCRIVAAYPFQLNAQVPESAATGSATLRVTTPNGIAEHQIVLQSVAPEIFAFPGQVAVTNQNGALNRPTDPATRGQAIVIYATGLGATTRQGNVLPSSTPVKVVLGGQELTPFYAGGTPGTPGLYQVNVFLPAGMPPALEVPLYLKQGGSTSVVVAIAVQ